MKHAENLYAFPMWERIVIATFLFFTYVNLGAQNTIQAKEANPSQFKNSISLSSFIFLGSAQLNYERLVGERHGIVVEGYYAFGGSSKGTPTAGLAYRYHFQKSLNGVFANAFYRWGDVHYKADFEENGTTNSYQMRTITNLVGLGIGYRKQWSNGLATVFRAGYGYQLDAKYEWLPTQPLNNSKKTSTEALQGMDIEISIGYSF